MGLQARAQEAEIALDTSVLSLAFRRRRRTTHGEHPAADRMRRAIDEGDAVVVPGICLQELLSGVRTREEFRKLSALMSGFPVLVASRSHHLEAARLANDCRAAGRSVATVDALVATLAVAHGATLLTTDRDFEAVARHSALKLEPY